MNWYYADKGQQLGPINEAEFERLIAEGKITPATLVWREGLASWQPLSQVRPAQAAAPAPLAPGTGRCASCGNTFPQGDLIQIGGRMICGTCKPTVVQQLKEGAPLPSAVVGPRDGPPWEQRATLGFMKAAVDTVKGVLTDPNGTFGKMKREGGLMDPLLFKVILGIVGGLAGVIYGVLFNIPNFMANSRSSVPFAINGMMIGVGIVALIVLMPVSLAIGAFISAGATHLCLMMLGAAKQQFETTFRVVCYATGATDIIQIVPVCGGLAALVWNIVAKTIGLAQAHETTTGKAVAAVLIPYVLCCGAVIVFYAAIFGWFFASMGVRH